MEKKIFLSLILGAILYAVDACVLITGVFYKLELEIKNCANALKRGSLNASYKHVSFSSLLGKY